MKTDVRSVVISVVDRHLQRGLLRLLRLKRLKRYASARTALQRLLTPSGRILTRTQPGASQPALDRPVASASAKDISSPRQAVLSVTTAACQLRPQTTMRVPQARAL